MPAVISAISGVFAAISSSAVGSIALRLLGSVALSALSQALAPQPKPSGLRNENTLSGGTTPEAFMLGATATGGTFVCPPMTHGSAGKTPNAFLTYVVELAGIPGHQLDGLILNGERVVIQALAPHPEYGQRIGGAYEGRAWIRYHDGTQTTADAMLLAKYPAPFVRPWSVGMVGEGICYAVLTFQYDREVFQGWPQCRFELSSVPLYDPRRDSSVGGEGAHRWGQPATYEPSNNTAVQIYNATRGIVLPSGDIWGGDIPAEDLPLPVWTAAMNVADAAADNGAGGSAPEPGSWLDQLIEKLLNGWIGQPGTEPLFRSGVEVQADDEPFAVIEELLKGCTGVLTETGGVWALRLGGPGLPVLFLEDDSIIADEAEDFAPFPPIDQIFNAISATHPDPASLWESRESELRTNPTWEAEDGGRRLPTSLSLPTVPYPVQVDRVCAALIADHRRMRRHVMTLDTPAALLEAGDTIAWSSAANGYDGKLFEVTELSRDIFTQQVRASLREVDPGDYDPPSDLVRPNVPVPTPVRPPVQSVPGFAVSPYILEVDGTERRAGILALWDPEGADDARGLRIAIRRAGDEGDGDERPPYLVPAGMAVITEGLVAGDYEVRGRLQADRATSWTAWLPVTVADLRLGLVELSADIVGWLGSLQEWIDGGVIDLPGELAGITAELGSLNGQTDQINSDLAVINGQIVTLGEQADQISTDVTAEFAAVNGQIASLAAQTDQINSDLTVINGQIATLGEQADQIGTDLSTELAVVNGQIASLGEQSVQTNADLVAGLAALHGEIDADIEALETTVTTGLAGVNTALADLESAVENDITTLQGNFTAFQGSVATDLVTIQDLIDNLGGEISGDVAAYLSENYYSKTATDGQIAAAITASETALGASIDGITATLASAYYTALQTDGAISTAISALETTLSSEIEDLGTEIASDLSVNYFTRAQTMAEMVWAIEGAWQDEIPTSGYATYAGISFSLVSRIDGIAADLSQNYLTSTETNGAISTAVAAIETSLGSQIDGISATLATDHYTKAQTDGEIAEAVGAAQTTLGAQLDALEGEVATKASAAAVNALDTRVTSAEGALSSIASDLSTLSASLGDLEDEVATKAGADALSALTVRVTSTEGELVSIAGQLDSLSASIDDKASADALSALTARVTEAEGELTSVASALSTLTAALAGKADASVVSGLIAQVDEIDGEVTALSEATTGLQAGLSGITATLESDYYTAVQTDGAISTAVSAAETSLGSQIEDLGTEIASDLSVNYFTRAQTMAEMVWAIEGAWQDEIPTSGYATYAGISFSLVSRIDGIAADLSQNYLTSTETNGAISTAVAAIETSLGSQIDGISATLATDHYTKAQTDGEIAEAVGAAQTALGAQLDALEGEVATKASASAVNALDTRVTSAEGALSSIASDLSTLSASLGDLEDEVATKAGADALSALTVRVTSAEGELVSIAGQLDSLSASIDDKASAAALSALTARVTEAEGELTSVASALNTLTAALAGKADASVVSGLIAQVDEIDGEVTALSGATTGLQAGLSGITATLESDYYTAAQTDGAISSAVSAAETSLGSQIEDLGTEIASDLSVNYFTRAQTMAEMVWAIEGAWQDEIPTSGYATYAGISFNLVSRIDGIAADLSQNYLTSAETNGAISTAVAAIETSLGSQIDGISATLATDHYTKAQTDGEIAEAVGAAQTALGAQLDALEGEVATKASAAAVNALDTRVTSAEGALSSIASDLSTLSASLGDLEDEVATKAGADALSALTVRVTSAEGELVSIAGQLDSLSASIDDKASADALSALTARVTEAEGELTSVASALNTLTAALAGKADASVVSGLIAQVDEIDGEVTALSGAMTSVQADVSGISASGLFRMEAVAGPSGYSRLALVGRTSTVETYREAGLYIDTPVNPAEPSRVAIAADQFTIIGPDGAVVPFIVDGDRIYLTGSAIRLTGDTEVDGTFAIRSGESGERVEIDASGLRIYNAANVALVKIGQL